jgi:DNA ligase-1
MIALPTLYSRTSTGAVQTWTIEVQEDKYRTAYGQVDGKEQTTNWTTCYATNEGRANARTGIEQALFEAKALWKKKKDSGCFEDIKDIDTSLFTEPMLAKKYEDYRDEIKYPIFSQPKLDGLRLVARKDGLFSRNGKEYFSVPHIARALEPIFKMFPNIILDGELYCDKFANDFNAICSLVKKTKPTEEDLKASEAVIQYWIYDWVDIKSTFSSRYDDIKCFVKVCKSDAIHLVSTTKVQCSKELDDLYAEYLQQEYEGQMVRVDKPYEMKRSKYLLKRKEFQDREYKIVGTVEGEGNKTGMLGAFVLLNDNGLTFNSNIKGTREYLQELWNEKERLIGRLATVKYFNLTPVNEDGTGGVPRFPYVIKIREDFDIV